jgi:uncharacterized phage-associated protein
MQLSFSHRKATQALAFLAEQAGGNLNKMKALKLIFFADRYHLRKYGRSITNDTYFAMKYGPVPSGCRNLQSSPDEYGPTDADLYASEFLDCSEPYGYSVRKNADQKVLSKSDVEALSFAWKNYQGKDQFALAEETHHFPEWKKHAAALESGEVSRRLMPYSDFLENPATSVDPLPPLAVEDQSDLRDEIAELHAIESVWS